MQRCRKKYETFVVVGICLNLVLLWFVWYVYHIQQIICNLHANPPVCRIELDCKCAWIMKIQYDICIWYFIQIVQRFRLFSINNNKKKAFFFSSNLSLSLTDNSLPFPLNSFQQKSAQTNKHMPCYIIAFRRQILFITNGWQKVGLFYAKIHIDEIWKIGRDLVAIYMRMSSLVAPLDLLHHLSQMVVCFDWIDLSCAHKCTQWPCSKRILSY